ncbi:MAG: YcgN family cysteine cluster protein [Mariprofundaceae bacterium]|nr:YcgN family cysteine cluster protein [Mariprofundaceae bacterium]
MHFWEKPLNELNGEQWEALCDGCALCCMHKFEDEDSGEMLYTDVACRLLDCTACRCTDYQKRRENVPECMDIRSFTAAQYCWLPETCAYRLRFEGKPLPNWHPLMSGDAETVHSTGVSMRGCCVGEDEVAEHELVEHIIDPDGELAKGVG